MIAVECRECNRTYPAPDEHAGRAVKCPRGHTVMVPAAGSRPAGLAPVTGTSAAPVTAALGAFAARLAVPFGIILYVLALIMLLGGTAAAFFVGDLSGGAAFMTFMGVLCGVVLVFSGGLALHMLAGVSRRR